MGAKTFHGLYDWVRHGMNLQVSCSNGHCSHQGVLDPHACVLWFRLHRWPDSIHAGALTHFRCSRCGARAGHARATSSAPTVIDFFPADDRGWKALQRRLRG